VILAILEAMEVRVALDAAHARPDPVFWPDVVDFLKQFADRCHHGKEEDCLFPALVAAGMPDEGGPVGVLKHEHEEGRAYIATIAAASAADDLQALRPAVRGYAALMRAHIDKENNVLFPIARTGITGAAAGAVADGFERIERDVVGDGTHCRYLGVAERLCQGVGVDLHAERGAKWTGGGCCGHHAHHRNGGA
jgi:hemerythrin-like domain-containing protein